MASRGVLPVLLILTSLGLAGCISSDEASSAEAANPEADLGAGAGVIQGVVVNDEWFPIKGADVTLFLEGAQVAMVRTRDDGAFLFTGLDMGTYEVAVLRVGYFPQSLPVPVDPTKAADLEFILERVPVSDPPFDVTGTIYGNVTVGAAGSDSEPEVGMGIESMDHEFVIPSTKEDGTPLAAVYTFIEMMPVDSPGAVDLDLYLMDPAGNEIASSTTGESHELIEVPKYLEPGSYTIRVVFWAGAAAQYQIDTLVTFEQGEAAEYVVKHQK